MVAKFLKVANGRQSQWTNRLNRLSIYRNNISEEWIHNYAEQVRLLGWTKMKSIQLIKWTITYITYFRYFLLWIPLQAYHLHLPSFSLHIVSGASWRRNPNWSALLVGHQCNRTLHPLSQSPLLQCSWKHIYGISDYKMRIKTVIWTINKMCPKKYRNTEVKEKDNIDKYKTFMRNKKYIRI